MDHHDEWSHRLSEVLDGSLDPEARRAAEAHLAECGRCRETLADLRQVVAEARNLGEIPPSRDLWPEIEAALEPAEPDVIALPRSAGGGGRIEGTAPRKARRGLLLSVPQLTAAAAVLILASSLATWWLRPDAQGGSVGPEEEAGLVRAAASEAEAPPELAQELEGLTLVVEEARERLDPGTVLIIERNLAVIEQAIEDSRRALAVDPGNAFLQEHLDRAYRRKLSYLREATEIVEWASS